VGALLLLRTGVIAHSGLYGGGFFEVKGHGWVLTEACGVQKSRQSGGEKGTYLGGP
jgi:hypothetical protein